MDGIIIINKEKDFTSHDVVSIVKRITKSKVGHTGTLDPNATGVLPLLVGNATKVSKYLINHDKEYEVVLELGKKTTTADIEGEILEEKEVPNEILEKENVENKLKEFIGIQMQVPPIYSAIKVNGKKLYDYARQGKVVKIEPRKIEIYDINLLNIDIENKQISFKVSCSKGTYIRSLCEDIASRLGTIGFMKELNRIKVGEFLIKDSIKIKELEEKMNNNNDLSNLITIEKLFKEKERIELEEKLLDKYLNGVKLNKNFKDGVYRIYVDNKFIGLGIIKDNKLKRDLVI